MNGRLLDWIDTGERERRADLVLRLGEAFAWAEREGVVEAEGSVEHAPCGQCLATHLAPITRIGASFSSYCYRTGKRVALTPEAVAAVRPNPSRFARALARAVNANGPIIERSRGRLWELGWLEVAGQSRSVFLSRDIGFARNLSTVIADLDARGSRWAGVILCTGSTPAGIGLKSSHSFRPLRECVAFKDGDICIDARLIASWMQGLRRPRSDGTPSKEDHDPEWLEPATQFWKELHAQGRLNRNASAMSRVIAELLGTMQPPLTEPPLPGTIYKALRPLHRRHYPSSEQGG